jgi:predicted oxidoreductase
MSNQAKRVGGNAINNVVMWHTYVEFIYSCLVIWEGVTGKPGIRVLPISLCGVPAFKKALQHRMGRK